MTRYNYFFVFLFLTLSVLGTYSGAHAQSATFHTPPFQGCSLYAFKAHGNGGTEDECVSNARINVQQLVAGVEYDERVHCSLIYEEKPECIDHIAVPVHWSTIVPAYEMYVCCDRDRWLLY